MVTGDDGVHGVRVRTLVERVRLFEHGNVTIPPPQMGEPPAPPLQKVQLNLRRVTLEVSLVYRTQIACSRGPLPALVGIMGDGVSVLETHQVVARDQTRTSQEPSILC